MNSLILITTTRLLKPLLLAFSIFVLLRGHQEPGGGFAGGLLAAAAFSIRPMRRAVDTGPTRRVDPHLLVGGGLTLALCSGLAALLTGRTFMTGLWAGELSTVLLFDVGVYLTVTGVVLMMVRTLAEE